MKSEMTISTNSTQEETHSSSSSSNHHHPYLHQDLHHHHHHHHQIIENNMMIEVNDSTESSTLIHSPSSSSISFSNSTQSATPPLTPIDTHHQITLPEIVHHSIDHSPTSSWFQPRTILSKEVHHLSSKSPILPLHIHQTIHHLPSSKETDLSPLELNLPSSSKPIKSNQHQHHKQLSSSILISRVLILIGLSLSSFLVIAYLVTTIPGLQLPTSLSHVSNQIHDLRQYSQSSPSQALHLLTIISLILIWKQTFSIPGTVFSNVLIGSLYGTFYSTLLTSFLTAVGSTLAYSLAIIARPLIYRYFPNAIKSVKNSLDCFKTHSNQYDQFELISYLLLARLIPILPYSALNLTSGAIGLPVLPFFLTLFFGSLPYNFLTTQVGHLIGIATRNHQQHLSIWNSDLLTKLVLISFLSCLPILFKNRLKSSILKLKRSSRSYLGF
ncbi:snare associated Golgi protein-domain-containing protein [Melampsora americana]|nr:snare associated Golgi protein-domain-containing protein [Melampsora americana]